MQEIEALIYSVVISSVEFVIRDERAQCSFVFVMDRSHGLSFAYRRPWVMVADCGSSGETGKATTEDDMFMVGGALFDMHVKQEDALLRYECSGVTFVGSVPMRVPWTLCMTHVEKMMRCLQRVCVEAARQSQLCFHCDEDASVCVVGVCGTKSVRMLKE